MPELIETLTNKKLDSYSSKLNDFKAERELTVEITLNEYRSLIASDVTKETEINKANKDKYTRESENKQLKEKNKELEAKLFEYRKRFGELVESEEEEND